MITQDDLEKSVLGYLTKSDPRKIESFYDLDLISLILSYALSSQKILFVKTSKKAETVTNETVHRLGRRKNKAS